MDSIETDDHGCSPVKTFIYKTDSMSVGMSCRPLRGEESHGEAVAV